MTKEDFEEAAREPFEEIVYDQFEALRIFGFVNMMDRLMIEQLALFLDFHELAAIASDRKQYSRLLLQFGAWKRDQLN